MAEAGSEIDQLRTLERESPKFAARLKAEEQANERMRMALEAIKRGAWFLYTTAPSKRSEGTPKPVDDIMGVQVLEVPLNVADIWAVARGGLGDS